MRVQKTTFLLGSLCSLLIPLTAYGESRIVTAWEDRPRFFTAEPGEEHSRFMNIVWYDRPRFFTRAEDEEHSRFYTLVSDRPRLFPRHHRCCGSGCCEKVSYNPCTYKSTCSTCPTRLTSSCDRCTHRSTARCSTVAYTPTCSKCSKCGTHVASLFGKRSHCGCRTVAYKTNACGPCDSCNRAVATTYDTVTTYYPSTSTGYVSVTPAPTMTDTDNSYGSSIHSNVTERTIAPNSQFTLTSDVGNRSLDAVVANWPQESRTVALSMQSKYGKPDSISNDQITWRDREPWAEITAFKNGTPHSFPTPHNDILAQSIYLDVAADKLDELKSFRGNVNIDHARGLLTSRCKDEAMNFLALNLAHDILQGAKSVVEANTMLAEKSRSGQTTDEYMTGLHFDVGSEMGNENKNVDTDSKVDRD